MTQVIIYKSGDGVAVIHPSPEALAAYGIEAIAAKDVPAGKPYKIIEASDLPSRSVRGQWGVEEADLTDGVGAEHDTFPKEPQA